MSGALVVGGGLAGGAMATLLARSGRAVVLVEREAGPVDKVCGEFLSREAGLYLRALGLDLPALGAVPIDTVRLCVGASVASAPLPFPALSLSRRVLDEALLALAAGAGATVRRGVKVQGLEAFGRASVRGFGGRAPIGGAYRARLEGPDGARDAVDAAAVFVATGKHDLRGRKRPAGLQGDLVAFKLHYRLAPQQAAELSGHVELVLFEGGYAGLSLVEGGRANLCLLVRRQRLAAVGQRWEGLLAAMEAESPHLAARLHGAEPCWSRPLALSSIPYGHVARRADGTWRLGDQAAVIPSFSGDGMSIALHSARLAANVYLSGGDADTFQRLLARDVSAQVRLSTVLSAGLVWRPAQAALSALVPAQWLPGLMSAVASRTRVSDAALARVGLLGEER
jgi:menaquinone-9 beta-reductase